MEDQQQFLEAVFYCKFPYYIFKYIFLYYVVVQYVTDGSEPNYREMSKEQISGGTRDFSLDVAVDLKSLPSNYPCFYLRSCNRLLPPLL